VTDSREVDFSDFKVSVKSTSEYQDFWDDVSKGKWEKNTLEIISRVLKEGGLYVDIGAWIGPTVLKASGYADKIIAYEPDPISWVELEENIRLNKLDFIELNNVALFDKQGEMSFGGGRSGALGMSVSTLMSGERGIKVTVLDINQELEKKGFRDAKLIKIDTEGAEYTIVPSIENFLVSNKPSLLLSCHSRRISGDLGLVGRIRHFFKRYRIAGILNTYNYKFVEVKNQWISFSFFQQLKFLFSPRKNYEFFVSENHSISRIV
jgi:FkbM family methyltransferase